MSKTKTVTLTGAETAVEFDRPFAYVECNNLSDTEILLSTKPNIERGADDVIIIKAGSTATIGDIGTPSIETVYLTGSGEVQLIGKGYAQSSFKRGEKGGGENNEQILLNMPLTSDLSDISGFNRAATYSGTTPLTIDENGLYLNKGSVNISSKFLPEKFAAEFDLKIEIDSTTADRPIISFSSGSYGIRVYVTSTASDDDFDNGFKIVTYSTTQNISAIMPTQKSYADGDYHHVILYYDKLSNFNCVTVDNSDPIAMRFKNGFVVSTSNIHLGGGTKSVLNGYIKNLIIKKMA